MHFIGILHTNTETLLIDREGLTEPNAYLHAVLCTHMVSDIISNEHYARALDTAMFRH